MSSKVIVVGKNSYVGAHLTNYLQAMDSEVLPLSSSDCDFLHLTEVIEQFDSFQNRPVSIVFLAVIKKDASNDYQSYLDNISLVNNLIKVASRTNICSIVYLSSVDVYGRGPVLPIIEQTRIDPDTWYGLAKYTCERMLILAESVECPITILRIPGIFGKGSADISVIGRMVASARADGHIMISGSGETLRDYVYVDDLCELIAMLIHKKYKGVINIATGKSRTILDIAKCVGQILNIELEIIGVERDARTFDLVFDTGRLKEIFPEFRFIELPTAIAAYM